MFSTCSRTNYKFPVTFTLSSVNAFNLDLAKFCHLVKSSPFTRWQNFRLVDNWLYFIKWKADDKSMYLGLWGKKFGPKINDTCFVNNTCPRHLEFTEDTSCTKFPYGIFTVMLSKSYSMEYNQYPLLYS